MLWNIWSSLSQGSTTPGAPVTAIPYGGKFAVFLADPGGGVYFAWGDPDTGWSGWAPIPGRVTTPGARISAIASGNRIALFMTAATGEVFSAIGSPDAGWGNWLSDAQGGSKPGAPVCPVPYGERIALFLADPGGGVYDTGGYPGNAAWGGSWASVSQGSTTPGAPVTAIPYSGRFAVFLADPNGGVYFTDGNPDTGWEQWRSAAQGSTTPGAPVCAVPYGDRVALFLADPGGGVYNTAGYPGNATWGGSWANVSQGATTPGAPVTAVPYNGAFAVFLADPNGGVYFVTGNPDAGWTGWTPVPGLFTAPGAHITVLTQGNRIVLFATNHSGEVFTVSTVSMLLTAEIQFDTLDDDKQFYGMVHVFVKNRLASSTNPDPNTDFISNYLALQRYQAAGDKFYEGRNPYIAFGLGLGSHTVYQNNTSVSCPLTLFSNSLTVNDVAVPQVDIHYLAKGTDRWIFNYTVRLKFDTGVLSFSSTADGVPGIILDEDNRDHTGMGSENPLRTLPIPVQTKAVTNSVMTKVTLDFFTHGSDRNEHDDKNNDTRLNIHIVNRESAQTSQDIIVVQDLLSGTRFPDSGTPQDLHKQAVWSPAPNPIRLADMVLPMVYIVIVPTNSDRWIFDYQVTFEFVDPGDYNSKPQFYSWRENSITLDQTRNKHTGIYQGRPFPTVAPPTAPGLSYAPFQYTGEFAKIIPVPFLLGKLAEFVTSRDGSAGALQPLYQLQMSAVLLPGVDPNNPLPLPETYLDTRSLYNGGDGLTHYFSSPGSFGQMTKFFGLGDSYLHNVNSGPVTIYFDATQVTPFAVTVNFQPGGTMWIDAYGELGVQSLSVTVLLTTQKGLTGNHCTVVDFFGWVQDIQNLLNTRTLVQVPDLYTYHYKGTFLGQPVDFTAKESTLTGTDVIYGIIYGTYVEQVVKVKLSFVNDSKVDPGGSVRQTLRNKIYDTFTTLDVLTGETKADSINSSITSWMLGGVSDDPANTDSNNVVVNSVKVQSDSITIDYNGPSYVFETQPPPDWPTQRHVSTTYGFSPSALDNIQHIVVLTKENRSFDHMLGYLSLPVANGGMGRQDIDGLKGGEFNPYQGKNYPVFPLTQTLFAPGPSNEYEAVHHAINGGQMDGFVKSYAEANGDAIAGQVMGYHTAATVPVFDRLARDFAIGHRWFASHPGPTFPNRFYELTGRPNLDPRGFWELSNSSPNRPVFTPTIFDFLNNRTDPVSGSPVTWRHFEHGYCTLRYYERYTFDGTNIVDFEDPQNGFFACAHAGTLPSVSFIDPHFVDYPPGSNCDEPPSDVAAGQDLVRRIVEAVVASPNWPNTLLLIVYDEPGGFYDHVPPPTAPRISPDFPVTTLGPRIPAFAISPWVAPGSVFGNPAYFDHTSILKTIARRFLRPNPPYLGARYAAANDLSSILTAQPNKTQFLPFIRYSFQYLGSGWMLDVEEANPAPGTHLWQFSPNMTNSQDYCFEQQADGSAYLRSDVSHLYVTVNPSLQIVQDVKYPASGSAGAALPASQRWMFTELPSDGGDGVIVEIWSQAYPNMRLRPSAPAVFQSEITLVNAVPASGEYRWRVLMRHPIG